MTPIKVFLPGAGCRIKQWDADAGGGRAESPAAYLYKSAESLGKGAVSDR